MPKPSWIDDRRQESERLARLPKCVNCAHAGEPCGYTNRTSKGRRPMYRCKLHPEQVFHEDTYACEDRELPARMI